MTVPSTSCRASSQGIHSTSALEDGARSGRGSICRTKLYRQAVVTDADPVYPMSGQLLLRSVWSSDKVSSVMRRGRTDSLPSDLFIQGPPLFIHLPQCLNGVVEWRCCLGTKRPCLMQAITTPVTDTRGTRLRLEYPHSL